MADEKKEPEEPKGVRCPKCNCGLHSVYYTRPRRNHIVRVRKCGSPICGYKWSTKEK